MHMRTKTRMTINIPQKVPQQLGVFFSFSLDQKSRRLRISFGPGNNIKVSDFITLIQAAWQQLIFPAFSAFCATHVTVKCEKNNEKHISQVLCSFCYPEKLLETFSCLRLLPLQVSNSVQQKTLRDLLLVDDPG